MSRYDRPRDSRGRFTKDTGNDSVAFLFFMGILACVAGCVRLSEGFSWAAVAIIPLGLGLIYLSWLAASRLTRKNR